MESVECEPRRDSVGNQDSLSENSFDNDVDLANLDLKDDGGMAGSDADTSESGRSWAENEYPQLDLNYDALRHITDQFLPGNHGKCVDIREMERGSFHEIRELRFQDGWSCIGRFTRNPKEPLSVTESEIATVNYVKKHTTIPVPETYLVNLDPTHPVGAQFALMEKIPGKDVYEIWEELHVEQKKVAIEQIADVLVQLSGLKFDKVGSIDMTGKIGNLQNKITAEQTTLRGPFSTTEEFLFSFIPSAMTEEASSLYDVIKETLHNDLLEQEGTSLYQAPFRLIHGDFDGQNMLFTQNNDDQSPKLSGIIDWDYSYAGPVYYLYEYPLFIRDVDTEEGRDLWSENKILRKHFVKTLAQKFPKNSEDRADVLEAFRRKSFMYNVYRNLFLADKFTQPDEELYYVRGYEEGLRGIGDDLFPYSGRDDYEQDSEPEIDEE